jgi:hypothetical protein
LKQGTVANYKPEGRAGQARERKKGKKLRRRKRKNNKGKNDKKIHSPKRSVPSDEPPHFASRNGVTPKFGSLLPAAACLLMTRPF